MIISVEVPDTFAKPLRLDGPQPERRALEALALDGYRSGELSRGQVSELLDLEVNETMAFLKDHGSGHGLTFAEHERSLERFRKSAGRLMSSSPIPRPSIT
jgi:hypothetical protein